jgi:hypothetical protein
MQETGYFFGDGEYRLTTNRGAMPNNRLSLSRFATSTFAILATVVAATAGYAQTRDCNPENGCIGTRNGMRVFSSNPTVQGSIGLNELFIDMGTKTFNGQTCQYGVVRLGQNTNRVFDPRAVQDTARQPGAAGGRPIQGCAPPP